MTVRNVSRVSDVPSRKAIFIVDRNLLQTGRLRQPTTG